MTDTEAETPSLTTFRQTRLGEHRVVLASTGANAAEPVLRAVDGRRLSSAIRQANDQRIPFVLTLRSTGVDVEDGIGAAAGWAGAARELVQASGVVPTVAIVSGPVVSGPALLLGLFDIVILTNDSYVYVNGPRNVETYTGVPISGIELGGASTHLRSTGLASMLVDDVDEALAITEDILAHLPGSVDHLPQVMETGDPDDRPCSGLGALTAHDAGRVLRRPRRHRRSRRRRPLPRAAGRLVAESGHRVRRPRWHTGWHRRQPDPVARRQHRHSRRSKRWAVRGDV